MFDFKLDIFDALPYYSYILHNLNNKKMLCFLADNSFKHAAFCKNDTDFFTKMYY